MRFVETIRLLHDFRVRQVRRFDWVGVNDPGVVSGIVDRQPIPVMCDFDLFTERLVQVPCKSGDESFC